jgi:hypothetical protein
MLANKGIPRVSICFSPQGLDGNTPPQLFQVTLSKQLNSKQHLIYQQPAPFLNLRDGFRLNQLFNLKESLKAFAVFSSFEACIEDLNIYPNHCR